MSKADLGPELEELFRLLHGMTCQMCGANEKLIREAIEKMLLKRETNQNKEH